MKNDKSDTWAAFMDALKHDCGFLMVGHGKHSLVDEPVMQLMQLTGSGFGINSNGYAVRFIGGNRNRTVEYLHRFVFKAKSRETVDHINRNKLDNRRCNLRKCTRQQNYWNSKWESATSKFKGVRTANGGRTWLARCGDKHLGSFKTENEAALAYNACASKTRGEFAYLNEV